MRITSFSRGTLLVAAATLLLTATLAAQGLSKVPDDLQIPRSSDSPGQVVFNHTTHLDAANPDCTGCHPKVFKILKSSRATRTPILHATMEKGQQCGMCHDGKKAFALDEDCTFCHKE
jgi:c(7)-type cytochrome triheme protein